MYQECYVTFLVCRTQTLFPSFIGHKDSIICTAFSHDSKFVATGDMSGLIIVWDIAAKKQVWNFETTDLEVCNQSTTVQGKEFYQ